MKKTLKKVLCLVLVVSFVLALSGCKKINYVTTGTIKAIKEVQNGTYLTGGEEGGAETGSAADEPVIAEFVAGTYGGVEFKTVDDVVNYYVEAYNYTKSLTAQYIDADGNQQTFYKLLGDEALNVGDVYIDGSANAVINKLVPGIVGGMFSANTYGLVPCNNRNPEIDNNNDDATATEKKDFRTSYLTPEHVLAANVTDNNDGTITLEIQPKAAEMSMRGMDSQGSFFEVLGDIGATVASISVVSFEEGDANDNVKVSYKGGTGKIKINTATKEITEADYHMVVDVAVNHATVTVIKNKSANLQITYDNHYPATDEFLKQSRGLTRV